MAKQGKESRPPPAARPGPSGGPQRPISKPAGPWGASTARATPRPGPGGKKSLADRLSGSRFRILNEKLYTEPSASVRAEFAREPELFDEYHDGFDSQVAKWPLNPVDLFSEALRFAETGEVGPVSLRFLGGGKHARAPAGVRALATEGLRSFTALQGPLRGSVVADMGCGRAKLAESVRKEGGFCQVRSFDLVAGAPGVEEADIAHTPLRDGEAALAVYSLSMMGTDHGALLLEANRVLAPSGELWVAEVSSRLPGSFCATVEKFGFKRRATRDFGHFAVFSFRKEREVSERPSGVPTAFLRPCLYKRR